MLLYGQLKGLGQWRNSGKGRFTFEVIDIIEDDPNPLSLDNVVTREGVTYTPRRIDDETKKTKKTK
jgi:hypothetical protein